MTHRPPIAKKATRTVFLKSLSLTLILCLLIQEFSYSAPELQKMDLGWRIEDGGEKQKNLNWAKKFLPDIPESIATIEDAWHSSSTSTLHTPGGAGGEASAARNEELHEHSGVPQVTGPGHTVILIQDAHTNNSGQLNEAKLLDILYSQKKNLSNYIFLEAGSGSESLSFLRKYASLEKRQQVAKSFLLQAKLQGTEYLDLTSDHNMTLWGVEDMTLYSKSVELYRRSAQRRQKFSDYLDRVDRTIRTLEPKFLNPYLLVFYQKLREHEQGKLSLQEYLGLLFNEAQKLELTGFKNLKVLQDLKDKEKEINFEEAQKEQAKFITSLSTQEQKEFLEASRSKDEQVHKAFLFLLSDKLKENTAFPNLQKYLTYFKYSQTLNPQEILREQKLLEEKVLDSLITTPDEKELIHASEGVAVLKKLFLLQCTPEDYQTYKKNKSNLSGSTLLTTSIQKITGFLNQKLMNQKDNYDKALFLENGYEDMVRYCEEFYELTYQRDQAFISNMLEVIESTKHPAMGDTEPGRPFTRSEELHEDKWAGAVAGPVAAHLHVLITGGYHTPNLKHLLKQNNISYISLTPQVLQETNLKRYEEILLKQKMPAPFQPANLAHTSMTTRVLAGGRLAELTEALGMKIDQGKWIEDRGWRIEGENQGARLAATSKPESNSPNEFKPSWIRYVAAVSIIATASVLFLNFGVGAPFLLIRPLSITVGNIASMFIQQEKNTGRYLWRLFLAASGGVASTLPVMGYFLLLGGWDNPDIGDYWMKPLADILGFSISANLILFLFMSAKDIDFTKPYKTWIPDIQKEFVRKLKAYFAPKGFYEINTAYWGPIASFCYTIATRSEMELNVVIMAVIYSLPLAFYAAKDPTKKSDGWKQATLERTYLLTPLLSAAMVPLSAWNGNWVGAGQWSWILLSGLAAWGISIGVTRWFIPKVLGIDLNPEKADRTSEPQAARLAGKIEKRMKGRGLRIEENQAGARLANDGSVNIEGLTPLFLRLSPVQAQRETAGARLAETSGKERPEWYLEDAVTDLNEALEVLLDRYVANDNSTPQSRLLMNRLFDRVGLLSRDISRMVEQQSYLDVIPLKNQVNRIHEKLNAVMQVISRTRDITRLTFFEIQLLVADDGLLRSVGDDLNKFVAGARLALHKNLSDIWWALLANVFENDELWPIKFINTKIGTNGMVQIANDVPFSIRRELKILKMQNLTHVLIVHDQNNPEELLIYPAEESDSQRGNFFNSPRPLIGAYYLKNEKMVTAQSIIGDRLKESKQLTKEGEIPKAVLMRVSKKPRKNRIYLFSAEKGRKVYLYSKKVTLGDLLRVEVDSNRMLRVYRLYPGKNRYEILAKGRLNKKGKFLWVRKKEGDSLGDKKASAARLADSKNKNSDIVINRQVDENLLGAEWANILAPSDFESGNEWTVLAVFRQTGDRFEGAYTKNNLGKHQQLRKQLYGKKPPIGISIYLGNESAGFLNVPFHIEVDPYQRLSGKQVKRAYFKSLIIVNDFLRNIIEKGYIEDTENPSLEVRLPNADDPGGALQKSRRMGIREASEIARRELALLESERVTQAARLAELSLKHLTISIRDMNILKIRGAKSHQKPSFVYQLLDDSTAMPLLAQMEASSAALTIPHELYKMIIPPSINNDGVTATGVKPPFDKKSGKIQIIYMRTANEGYISTGYFYNGKHFMNLEELRTYARAWVAEKYGSLKPDPEQPYIYYVPRLVWWRTVTAGGGSMAVRNDDMKNKDSFQRWNRKQLQKKSKHHEAAGIIIRVEKRIPEKGVVEKSDRQPDYFSKVEVYSLGKWLSYDEFIRRREVFARQFEPLPTAYVTNWLKKIIALAHPESKGAIRLVFHPGMRWRNMTEWWKPFILRATIHEGDDFALFHHKIDGNYTAVEAKDNVPSPGFGQIEAVVGRLGGVVPVYMGDALIIKLLSPQGEPLYADRKKQYESYLVIMHVNALVSAGQMINPDDIIATVADPKDSGSPAPAHVHVTRLAARVGYDFKRYGLAAINPSNHRGDVWRVGLFEGIEESELEDVAVFESAESHQNLPHVARHSFEAVGTAARLADKSIDLAEMIENIEKRMSGQELLGLDVEVFKINLSENAKNILKLNYFYTPRKEPVPQSQLYFMHAAALHILETEVTREDPSKDQASKRLLKILDAYERLAQRWHDLDPQMPESAVEWLLQSLSLALYKEDDVKTFSDLRSRLHLLPGKYRYEAVAYDLLLTGAHLRADFRPGDAVDIERVLPNLIFALSALKDGIPLSDTINEVLQKKLKNILYLGLLKFVLTMEPFLVNQEDLGKLDLSYFRTTMEGYDRDSSNGQRILGDLKEISWSKKIIELLTENADAVSKAHGHVKRFPEAALYLATLRFKMYSDAYNPMLMAGLGDGLFGFLEKYDAITTPELRRYYVMWGSNGDINWDIANNYYPKIIEAAHAQLDRLPAIVKWLKSHAAARLATEPSPSGVEAFNRFIPDMPFSVLSIGTTDSASDEIAFAQNRSQAGIYSMVAHEQRVESALRSARSESVADRVHFIAYDINQPWPYRDNSANFIYSRLPMDQTNAHVFSQMERVLVPGGLVFIALDPKEGSLRPQAESAGFESIPLPVDYPYLVVMKKFPQVEFISKGDHDLRSLRLMPEIPIRFILGNNAVEVSLLASGHVKIAPVGRTEISTPSPQGAEIGFLNVAVIGRRATSIQNATSVIISDPKDTISRQHLQMMPVNYFGLPFLQVINLSENQPVKINNAAEAPTDDPEPPQPSDEFLTLWAQYTKMLIKEPRRAEGMLKRLEQDYRDRVSAQLALEAENKPFGVRLASATSPTDSRHPQSEIQGPPIAARLAVAAEDFTPDDAVEFLTQVFGERHGKTGRLWIGSKRFRSHFDQKTQELVILGFGRELLRTKDWKTKRAFSERHVLDRLDARPMDSVGISLSDFKILLQNSFDAVKALPSDPALDQKKALVIINLESLNSKLKGFDNVILPLLIRELAYAHRHSYGKEVKYLLTGRKTSLDVAATLLAEYFREGQDFIYMQGKAVPAEYKHRRASVTNPRKPRRGRNFYIQMPQDGDILNFRATLLLAARLARIKELNVNDSDFIQFKQSLEIFLGRPIEDTADFIAAIESISKNRNRYALPVLASVSGSLALAAARLANSMTEQSA